MPSITDSKKEDKSENGGYGTVGATADRQLPEKEPLRVEGVIVGLTLAHAEQAREPAERQAG